MLKQRKPSEKKLTLEFSADLERFYHGKFVNPFTAKISLVILFNMEKFCQMPDFKGIYQEGCYVSPHYRISRFEFSKNTNNQAKKTAR